MTTFPTRIKVLQLEFWMKIDDNDYNDRTPDSNSFIGPAIIGKDAWYYDATGVSWFEFAGNSYATRGLAEQFKFKLATLSVSPLTNEQVQHLRKLVNTLPKSHSTVIASIRQTLQNDYSHKSIRDTSRSMRKSFMIFEKSA